MSLVANIGQAYRAPRAAFRQELDRLREPRSLMIVVLFCLLSFIARMPEVSALSHLAEDDAETRSARFGAMFVATVLFAPLVLYVLGFVAHAILSLFGGRASWAEARLALFWSALVTSPLVLTGGVLKVFSPDVGFLVAQILTAVVFFWQWATCIAVSEFGMRHREPA